MTLPVPATRASRTATVWSASMERSTLLARASLVNSSVTARDLEGPRIGGLVEAEVEGSDLVGAGGPQPGGRHGRGADAIALLRPYEHSGVPRHGTATGCACG